MKGYIFYQSQREQNEFVAVAAFNASPTVRIIWRNFQLFGGGGRPQAKELSYKIIHSAAKDLILILHTYRGSNQEMFK